MTSEAKILKRFTHSEIVNYLMEFHFTIRTYIREIDIKVGKFTVCENRGVTTNFSVYHLHEPMPSGAEIIKRFTNSKIVNYLMEFHFTYLHLYLRTWHQIGKFTVCENRGVTTNFSVYNLHEPMT